MPDESNGEILRTYLKNWANFPHRPKQIISTWAEYLQENGAVYASQPLDVGQLAYLREMDIEGATHLPNSCYFNAQNFIMRAYTLDRTSAKRLAYCEGIALSGRTLSIPLHHGWVILDGKHVVDLTWRKNLDLTDDDSWLDNRAMGELPEGVEYYGTIFPVESIIKHWTEAKVTCEMLPYHLAQRAQTIGASRVGTSEPQA